MEIADGGTGPAYECICDINEADELFVAMTDSSLAAGFGATPSEQSVLLRVSGTDGTADWSVTMRHGGTFGSPVHVADLAGFANHVGIVGHIGAGGPGGGMVRTYTSGGTGVYANNTASSDVYQIEYADELGSPVSDEAMVIGHVTGSEFWSLSPADFNWEDSFGPYNARNYSGCPSRDGYVYSTNLQSSDTELRRFELDNISSGSPYDDADWTQTGSTLTLDLNIWGGRHRFSGPDVRFHMMSVYGTGSEVWIHLLR